MGIMGERGEGTKTGKKAQRRKSENLFLIDLTQLQQKNAPKNTEKFQNTNSYFRDGPFSRQPAKSTQLLLPDFISYVENSHC